MTSVSKGPATRRRLRVERFVAIALVLFIGAVVLPGVLDRFRGTGSAAAPPSRPPSQPHQLDRFSEPATAARAVTTVPAPGGLVAGTPVAFPAGTTIDLRALLLCADGNEPDLPALRQMLERIGVPFDVTLAASGFDPTSLVDGTRARYRFVVLCSGDLAFKNAGSGQWASALNEAQWDALHRYEATFGVREATSNTFANAAPFDYGLKQVSSIDTTALRPIVGTLTSAGREVFADLNASVQIPFVDTRVNLSTVVDPQATTPLVVTADGYTLVSLTRHPDGRETLSITAASGKRLLSTAMLGYGIVRWGFRGLFVGERVPTIDYQVDDLFAGGKLWDPKSGADGAASAYRLSGADATALVAWQQKVAAQALATGFRLELAFNGRGATGIYKPDTLTPVMKAQEASFAWLSHTYRHPDLTKATTELVRDELERNDELVKNTLKFTHYVTDSMVQPSITGLDNPDFYVGASAWGIRYVISDASRPEWSNPTPNAGLRPAIANGILVIPRHATSLFYDVVTPEEWVSEYNLVYGPNGTKARWDHPLTYDEILHEESGYLLEYLLAGDIDPVMFHQGNLGAYDGVHSVLGDLVDVTLRRYAAASNVPVRTLTQHDVGGLVEARMALDASGVVATLTPCRSVTVSVTAAATVPLSGVHDAPTPTGSAAVSEPVTPLTVAPGQPQTVAVSSC